VTIDRLQLSLDQIYSLADDLQAGRSGPAATMLPSGSIVGRDAVQAASAPRTRRVIWSTVRHTVVTIAVVVSLGAAADPLLPQPPGPRLGAAEPAGTEAAMGSGIPQSAANRP